MPPGSGPPETLSDSAVQTVYRAGVPHTDRHGTLRTRYDTASFFPRCIYHAVAGSFRVIREAGFTPVERDTLYRPIHRAA